MTYYIRQKIFSLGDKYNVLDDHKNPCFNINSKIFSFVYKGEILDIDNNSLVKIEQEIFHFLPYYNIIKDDKIVAIVKKEFKFFQNKFNIESDYGDFTIEGNFFAFDFKLYKYKNLVATISKTFFCFTDYYQIETTDEIPPEFSIALVIIIDSALHNENKNNN